MSGPKGMEKICQKVIKISKMQIENTMKYYYTPTITFKMKRLKIPDVDIFTSY